MKKLSCLLMVLMLITLTLPVVASASAPGDTVTVSIRISTSGAIARVRLSYNASVLEFVSASGGNVAPISGTGAFMFGSGTAAIGSASGTVTFRIKSDAPDGTYYVGGNAIECYDTNGSTVSCSVSGGNVVVSTGSSTPTVTTKPTTGGNTARPTRTAKPDMGTFTLTQTDEETGDTSTKQVTMMVWGLAKCEVTLNGARAKVNTLDLQLSPNVTVDQQLAVIYAPNTGKAALRKTAKTSSAKLMDVNAGVIVPVESIEGECAQVTYLGHKGYVRLSSLRFYAPCEGEGTGTIRNASGSEVILRLARDNGSQKVCKIPVGAEVYVIKTWSEWYEIDYQGYHGFVPKNRLEAD